MARKSTAKGRAGDGVARADRGGGSSPTYRFRLYISGMTPRSARAVENIQALCQSRLAGRFELAVVDLYCHPEEARGADVIAAPTLIKLLPPPLRRFIGDLSDFDRILARLDLEIED